MTLTPVDHAAAALAAGDEEGRERLRAALEAWPARLRRRVYARFRGLASGRTIAGARGAADSAFERRPVSQTPLRAGGQGPESRQLRPSDTVIQGPDSIDPKPKARKNRRPAGLSSDPEAATSGMTHYKKHDVR
jgi:hypothetical protein